MTLSTFEKRLLLAIHRDIRRLASQDWDYGGDSGRAAGRERLKILDARQGMVTPDLFEWLGHAPTVADRKRASRAYERIQAAGLLIRHCYDGGNRTTQVSLTPAGNKLAAELDGKAKPAPEPTRVRDE